MNAKLRQQKIREQLQDSRKANLKQLSEEFCARTEANEEEAAQIWETAQAVVQKVNDYNASLETNETGYETEYIGCYKDKSQRDLPTIFNNYQPVTRADCFAEAKARGFKYIGHQYGGECFMSNEFGKYGQANDSDCNMACRLEADLICGGGWRNSIWAVNEFDPEEKRI